MFAGPLAVVDGQGAALVVDDVYKAMFAVDLATGDRVVVSDAERGVGVLFDAPIDIAFDARRDRALVLNRSPATPTRLFAIDRVTGDRHLLVDSHPALWAATRVCVVDGTALVAALDGIVSVDLGTGTVARAATNAAGRGPTIEFGRTVAMHWEPSKQRLLLMGSARHVERNIYAVDLATQDRELLTHFPTSCAPRPTWRRTTVWLASSASPRCSACSVPTADRFRPPGSVAA